MVNKNKNHTEEIIEKVQNAANHVGLSAMVIATALTMAELEHKRASHEVVGNVALQPAYAMAEDPNSRGAGQHADWQQQVNHELRGGRKEEIRHTSATYGQYLRSHSVSGTR
jgi:hypothetical protein